MSRCLPCHDSSCGHLKRCLCECHETYRCSECGYDKTACTCSIDDSVDDKVQGPYVAWFQTDWKRMLVEIVSEPRWSVTPPYKYNWTKPQWYVDAIDPDPDSSTHMSGTCTYNVRDLHPMNKDTRELLALRDGGPESPFTTPEYVKP